MRSTLVALLLLVPALVFGQSLGEVAKKEKERREKNKQAGKRALVISEDQLSSAAEGSPQTSSTVETGARPQPSRAERSRPTARDESDESDEGVEYDEEGEYEDDVPNSIPPDIPLEERVRMFDRMKRHYRQQVREIDNAIAENNEQIRQLDAQIASTTAAGGGGLPVAPQTGPVQEQLTGQGTQNLVADKQRLETMNETMTRRKQELKLDLQTKGRVAGIPQSYLDF